MDKKLIEISRECEYDKDGKMVVKNIKYEPEARWGLSRKDYLDSLIKIIGAVAIFVPIALYYLNQRSEFRSQRNLLEFQAFSELSVQVHSINLTEFQGPEFHKIENKILYELIPRARLFNNPPVQEQIDVIADQIHCIYYADLITSLVKNYNFKQESVDSTEALMRPNFKLFADFQYYMEDYIKKVKDLYWIGKFHLEDELFRNIRTFWTSGKRTKIEVDRLVSYFFLYKNLANWNFDHTLYYFDLAIRNSNILMK